MYQYPYSRTSSQQIERRWCVHTAKCRPSFAQDPEMMVLVAKRPTEIAKIVDEFLRLSSIEARFDNNEAEALCKTVDSIKFKISLFLDSSANDSTYVDMILIKGCRLTFRKYKETLTSALKDYTNIKKASQMINPRRQQRTKQLKMKQFKLPPDFLSSYVPPTESELEDILIRASDRMHSRDNASVISSLQNLISMTSLSMNTSEKTVNKVVDLVMENKHQIWDNVMMVYDSHINSSNEDISTQIVHECLRFILNILSCSMSEKECSSLMDTVESISMENLTSLLIDTVACFKNVAYNACLALKCISKLITNSSASRKIMKESKDRIIKVMEQAEAYGYRENLKLQLEATATIHAFNNI